jgi:hypothetical protein
MAQLRFTATAAREIADALSIDWTVVQFDLEQFRMASTLSWSTDDGIRPPMSPATILSSPARLRWPTSGSCQITTRDWQRWRSRRQKHPRRPRAESLGLSNGREAPG